MLKAHRTRGDAVRVGGGTVHPADGIAHALAGVLDEGLLGHRKHEEESLEEEDALVRNRVWVRVRVRVALGLGVE
jgi:hypothetical protein